MAFEYLFDIILTPPLVPFSNIINMSGSTKSSNSIPDTFNIASQDNPGVR